MMLFSAAIMCLLALITLLGGLFLLAYSKKEGLGKFSKLASYLAISFSSVVFLIGIIGMFACPARCGSGHCSKNSSEVCHKKDSGKCETKSECSSEASCHKEETSQKSCCKKEISDEEYASCPKGEGCSSKEECSSKMTAMENCNTACMKKCEKQEGSCDDACKKKCESK